jgi:hypothetical protein
MYQDALLKEAQQLGCFTTTYRFLNERRLEMKQGRAERHYFYAVFPGTVFNSFAQDKSK